MEDRQQPRQVAETAAGAGVGIKDPEALQHMTSVADRIGVLSEEAVAAAEAIAVGWHAAYNASIDEIADALRNYAKASRLALSERWLPDGDATEIHVDGHFFAVLPHSDPQSGNSGRAFVGDTKHTWMLVLRWPNPLSPDKVVDVVRRQGELPDCSTRTEWSAGLTRIIEVIERVANERGGELTRAEDGTSTTLRADGRVIGSVTQSRTIERPTVAVVTSRFRWMARFPCIPDEELLSGVIHDSFRQ